MTRASRTARPVSTVLAVVAALAVRGPSDAVSGAPPAPRPNVVVVLLDDRLWRRLPVIRGG